MIINDYKDRIIDKFGDKYKQVTSQDFEKFIRSESDKIENSFLRLYREQDLYLNDFMKKLEKTRRRWVTTEVDKKKSTFHNEISTATNLFEEIGNKPNSDIFKAIYDCYSPKDLYNRNLKRMQVWKDNKGYFIDFMYIKDKRRSAIKPAICNDIILFLLNNYKEEDRIIIKVPYMLQHIPEDTTNRAKLWGAKDIIEENIETEDRQLYYDDKTGEEVGLTVNKSEYVSFISGGAVTELDKEIRNEIVKQLKVFNSLDRDILQYVLQQRKELYSRDKIERDLSEIVIATGRKNTNTAREDVKNTLYKLGSCGYSKDGKFVGRFFSVRIEPIKAKNGFRDVVYIYIDGMLREVVLSNNTFNFYADKFNSLSKDAQKILIGLQSERILRVLNEDMSLIVVKTLSDFRKFIYFNNKRTIKPRTLSALDELVKQKMAVRSYSILNKYEIEIEFFRFAERDINLITGENFKYGDFVDGSYDMS